ncbi:MAG TPA: hypothetical protein EYQ43_09185 [Methyloprofundus sp.]|nr:hypothetical protein [Methyloprofundus sp.]
MIQSNQELQKRLDAMTTKSTGRQKIIVLADNAEQTVIDSGYSIEQLRGDYKRNLLCIIQGVNRESLDSGKRNYKAFKALIT